MGKCLCPNKFMANCKNNHRCHQCKAFNYEEGTLLPFLYKPKNNYLSRNDHPYSRMMKGETIDENEEEEISNVDLINMMDKANQGRLARLNGMQSETSTIKSLNLRPTRASGSINGDGDAKLSLGVLDFSIEIKYRGNKNKYGITKTELLKGDKQGIDIYIINSDDTPRLIMMKEDTFNQLIAYVKELIDA